MLTDDELVKRCAAWRQKIGAPLPNVGEIATDYVEGMDLDGTPNQNRKNAFDDLHLVYTRTKEGTFKLLYKAECTTQPGARFTLKPINPDGAAIIDLGYQEVWQYGLHRQQYPALVQTGGKIRITRDPDKTFQRTTHHDFGYFGINQHHGGDAPRSDIGGHSAGCLVTRLVVDHQKMLAIKRTDIRYKKGFVFGACVMTAAQCLGTGDMTARPRPELEPDMPASHKVTTAGGGASLTGLASWFNDYWEWFVIAAVVVVVAYFIYYWREPFAPPDVPNEGQ